MLYLRQILPKEQVPANDHLSELYFARFPGAHSCLVPQGDPGDERYLCIMAGIVPLEDGIAPHTQIGLPPIVDTVVDLRVGLTLPDNLISHIDALQQQADANGEGMDVDFQVEQHVPYFAINYVEHLDLPPYGNHLPSTGLVSFWGGANTAKKWYDAWLQVKVHGSGTTIRSLTYHQTLVGRIVKTIKAPIPG